MPMRSSAASALVARGSGSDLFTCLHDHLCAARNPLAGRAALRRWSLLSAARLSLRKYLPRSCLRQCPSVRRSGEFGAEAEAETGAESDCSSDQSAASKPNCARCSNQRGKDYQLSAREPFFIAIRRCTDKCLRHRCLFCGIGRCRERGTNNRK